MVNFDQYQNPGGGVLASGDIRTLVEASQMRFLGVAVILPIVLVSSDMGPVGPTIGPANTGPALAADAQPVVARSRPEVQQSFLEDRDRDAALVLLLFGMFEGRRGR
jgi:hypothetical protein